MSHVSSVTKSSYPYRGTLAELDTNGDGLVSQQEIAAAQRPGLLMRDATGDSGSLNPLSSVIAVLMKVGTVGSFGAASQVTEASSDSDMQTSLQAYRNTYGQYDVSDAAA